MPLAEPPSDHPTIFDPSTCIRKGLCPISSIRHKDDPLRTHSLYYELHGTGPEKVIFIMGLNSTSFAWEYQVKHFSCIEDYSVLVFDNRGIGHSSVPKGPYSTSSMADDAIALLNYVGWTEARDLHVVGVSLGGMIAQELALKIPERILSLTLTVTTAGGRFWSNMSPWKGFSSLFRSVPSAQPEDKIPIVLSMLYPKQWLDLPAEDGPQGRTNREIEAESFRRRMTVTRPPTFIGSVSQMAAALTHNVSPERLNGISRTIPKVTIVIGDEDHLVRVSNSFHLQRHMPEAEFVQWNGTGHGVPAQQRKRFNVLLERVFAEGKQRAQTDQRTEP
ncbi:alpha/beta-hydrolase [Irpex rosettiformis]|uniref:Alpha/beta-hydrolase n=1 Tax=Irpex rosettiformis TaxID=378272 RepID=A0ACB8TPU2_9APHY|nr:alpha/beta-hydrolase [Irpex rosettiformis]